MESKEYKHNWCSGLKTALVAIYEYAEPVKLAKLNLTFAERTNAQKLAYFGLIRKTGYCSQWAITELGLKFVRGEESIPRWVSTVNSNFTNESAEKVFFKEEADGYKSAYQYAEGK